MSSTTLIPSTAATAVPSPLPSLVPSPYATASRVAAAVAGRREHWARHVRFDPQEPHEVVVAADERWEVLLGAWLPGQSSRTVEHLDRPGVLHVLQGVVEETTWATATDGPVPGRRHAVSRRYAAGATRSHGAVHVHDVRNPGPDPAIVLLVRRRG